MKTLKPRTICLKPNDNISLPVGTTISVKNYSKFLELGTIFSKFKQKGIPLLNILEAIISYRLTENISLTRASNWINREEVLEEFGLKKFEQRTLFRAIETIGENYRTIILDLQDIIFDKYDFSHTDVNMDWSSLILWGNKSELGKHGYSRDHRPDKKQITFGVTELRKPINIPIGLTIAEGNLNDQKHFQQTFNQVKDKLKEGSNVIFDKGANSKDNLNSVIASKMKFLTAKKLNKSDDQLIKKFWSLNRVIVDSEKGIFGFKQEFPARTNYFFFSKNLQVEQLESKMRKASKFFKEAQEIQKSIDSKKKLPKKFLINNPLVDMKFELQTKLQFLSEKEAFEKVKKASITGREGFFCLTSSDDLTLEEALSLYREKDSVEKIMHSLKNEICIKPVRVWSTNSINGVLLIGYLAQLIISLIRYDHHELKNISTKFIKISLSQLTVTIEKLNFWKKRRIYSNFDPINELICLQNQAIT
ncbi:MAG: transposase [Herbaspirillum sp.]|uniref:IS1634 family transposase n=1 Tax=Herbaspirillum sp. TaxID=1890675 RepID=UPI00258C5D78|nr:transposase [Herbaspirillum sp.]MCP4557317.1 transposase [Herbaspirillum sp.]